jgi:hypothetical protein
MARPGLTTHRKFRRLVRVLGSPILARGALELLWDSCYEAGEDYVGTSEDIENLVGWQGDPGMLTRALAESGAPEGFGFLEPVSTESGRTAYRVHDLWHHAPDYVAKRRQREMARQSKEAPKGSDGRRTAPNGGQWPPTSDWQNESGRTPSPSPSPSPSHGGKNVSSEPHAASEPPTAGRAPKEARPSGKPTPAPHATDENPSSVPALPPSPPFLEFPVIGSEIQTWSLSVAQVAEWERLFPGVDVRGGCRKALAWCHANFGRRKTAKGMARFLVAWLTREADSGRGRRHEPSAGSVVSARTEQNLANRDDAMRLIQEHADARRR